MKHTQWLFILWLIAANPTPGVYAQSTGTDALTKKEQVISKDRVDQLNSMAEQQVRINKDNTIAYAKEALDLARKLNYLAGMGEANRLLGIATSLDGDFERSYAYFQESLHQFDLAGDEHGKNLVHNGIGELYYKNSHYAAALDYFLKSLAYWKEIGDNPQIACALNDIGNVHFQQRDFNEAKDYYARSLEYESFMPDSAILARTYNNLGSVYYEQNDLSRARDYHLMSLETKRAINDQLGIAVSFNNLGDVLEKEGQLEEATTYQLDALKIARTVGNLYTVIYTLNKLADLMIKQKELRRAKSYLDSAMSLQQEASYQMIAAETFLLTAEYYQALGNYSRAFDYLKQYNVRKDSIFNRDASRQIAELRTRYETEQKDQENQFLKEKQEMYEAQIRDNYIINAIICLALVLAIALIVVLKRSNSTKQKANQLLVEQNIEINRQKERLEAQSKELRLINTKLEDQKGELTQQKQQIQKAYNELNDTLEKLKMAQSQLIQAEKMASLGQLTAGVAHEINNPVNFIYAGINGLDKNLNAFIEVADKYDQIDTADEFARIKPEIDKEKASINFEEVKEDINDLMLSIREGATRTAEIVRSLQIFSHTDDGVIKKEDIHRGLDSTLMILNNKVRDHIKIEKFYDPRLSEIECYPGQLNQVFMNILSNAIEAIGTEQGTILITTEDRADEVRISIKDDGPGIPAKNQSKIFEPFFTTKGVGKGTGLGLSISYGIIQKHKGQIKLKSQLGKGTEFILILPKTIC